MKRVFFDWDRPFLPAVADYIVRTDARANPSGGAATLDLGNRVYVLPGSRAIRTLESYLQLAVDREIAAGRISPDWTPPTFSRLGAAPELLYPNDRRIANYPTRLGAMRRALDEFFALPSSETEALMRDPGSDLESRLRLAESFLTLKDELESERKTYEIIEARCREEGLEVEARRWRAIKKLDSIYESILKANKVVELNRARRDALGSIAENVGAREFRIVGAVDLNDLQKTIFEKLGDRVEFWIFAPESEAEGFDEFGRIVPDVWTKRAIPIADRSLFQVATPSEQGEAVALLIRELSKVYDEKGWEYERFDPLTLAIGVPSDEVGPFVERSLAALGLKARIGEGIQIAKNRAYRLLALLANYLETRDFSTLSELLRKVDLEIYLRSQWRFIKSEEPEAESASEVEDAEALDDLGNEDEEALEPVDEDASGSGGDWSVDLDDYGARYAPTRVDGKWFRYQDPDDERRNRDYLNLRKATGLLHKLLSDCDFRWDEAEPFRRSGVVVSETTGDVEALRADFALLKNGVRSRGRREANQAVRPVKDWARSISKLARTIYEPVLDDATDRETVAQIEGFFKALNQALDALNEIPEGLVDETTGSGAIRVVLKELGTTRIQPSPESGVVEALGWLDLLFDDAPDAIVTGFNDGIVPSSRSVDLFLPNETRSRVGLSDSARVWARDAYLATALVESKRNALFIFGETDLEGDPLTPSRFVFATDPENVPERVVKFFNPKGSTALAELRNRQRGADGTIRRFPTEPSAEEGIASASAGTGDAGIDALVAKSAKLEREREKRRANALAPPKLDVAAQSRKKSRFNLNSMNVTDFQTFLASPYRFFLKKVFGLYPSPDPTSSEFDAGKFGTFAHDALRDFGTSDMRDSTDEGAIGGWLSERLNQIAERFVDDRASPYARVQIEQIRSRLWGFARWQAKWRASGRVIKWVEKSANEGRIPFEVGDRTIWINGRIDRIDYCAAENRWYVFDYKTFDSCKPGSEKKKEADSFPEVNFEIDGKTVSLLTTRKKNSVDEKHRVKRKETESLPLQFLDKMGLSVDESATTSYEYRWTNLQLPLYRRFLWRILYEDKEGAIPLEEIAKSTKFTLAYIILPKSGETTALGAPWNELDLRFADATAHWTIRAIERLWGVVDPRALVDPSDKSRGPVLDNSTIKYADDYAPLTLSFVADA